MPKSFPQPQLQAIELHHQIAKDGHLFQKFIAREFLDMRRFREDSLLEFLNHLNEVCDAITIRRHRGQIAKEQRRSEASSIAEGLHEAVFIWNTGA
jgi:hypothetical protein